MIDFSKTKGWKNVDEELLILSRDVITLDFTVKGQWTRKMVKHDQVHCQANSAIFKGLGVQTY